MVVAASVFVLAMFLGWMSVYAKLVVTGYSRSKLVATCRQEQLRNQRLKLRMEALSSPGSVVDAARKAGMVYATEYDYIRTPRTVATAVGEVGD
jgi:cell division protein FtsL